MHGLFLIGLVAGLLHATALAVIGFFVLFAAGKSTGALKRLGEVLGAWLFILAVLAIIGGAFVGSMVGRFHHGWAGHPGWGPPPAAPVNSAPAGK